MTRMFFMTRGVPGCGKSTFIRENNLEPYTVSSDDIRLLLSSPVRDADGNMGIDQSKMNECWKMIENILRRRFESGATTILDATNLKSKDIRPLRNLAQEHRYRVYVIDFTDVPEDEIYRHNAGRDELNRVPEHAIARMLNIARESKIPGSITQVTREEAIELLNSPYETCISKETKAVNVIGDIHGCATALASVMAKVGDIHNTIAIEDVVDAKPEAYETKTIEFALPLKDEKYIFVGDLLDRGIENAHVARYMHHITTSGEYDVTVIEGNHEKWLRIWGNNGEKYVKNEFLHGTKPQLEASRFTTKQARALTSKLSQYCYFNFETDTDQKQFFVCHGGLSCFPMPFASVSAKELISGSGRYEEIEDVDASWESRVPDIISIHGHRSFEEQPLFTSEHVICLEGSVEYGGQLRAVRIYPDENGKICIEDISCGNTVFDVPDVQIPLEKMGDISAVVEALRANPLIKEKQLKDGISSFNFSRKAFAERMWDTQTVKARGLFIDTENMKIKARSYDKFFAIGEREETRLERLGASLKYPVVAYAKENGYLGICSYNDDGSLFCASKSTNGGIYASRFSAIIHQTLGAKAEEFARYLKENNLSAAFEVIDPENDYHLVKYDYPCVVMLDLVKNSMQFEDVHYDELCRVGEHFGLKVKVKAKVLHNAKELTDWYSKVRSYNYRFDGYDEDAFGNLDGTPVDGYKVEGFVLCDSQGFQVKVKNNWYLYWKFFRGVARDIARRGKSAKVAAEYITEMNDTPDVSEIYAFLKEQILEEDKQEKDSRDRNERGNIEEPNIIELRQKWETLHG